MKCKFLIYFNYFNYLITPYKLFGKLINDSILLQIYTVSDGK